MIRFFLIISFFCAQLTFCNTKQYYCTAADSKFFNHLINFIGGIHKYNYEDLEEISVYDLGLEPRQRKTLLKMSKVMVYQIEKTNPYILDSILTAPNGRKVKGAFSWKPVVIKQALERFPYVLYLDAGISVVGDLSPIFDYIVSNGYFFLESGPDRPHNIVERTTDYVIKNFIDVKFPELKQVLLDDKTMEMSAGVQGVSKVVWNSYILPMYEASKDFFLFHDDKTTPLGWGSGRHDQIIFSIVMHANDYKMFPLGNISLNFPNRSSKDIYCHYSKNDGPQHLWFRVCDFAKDIKFKESRRGR